MQTQIVENWSEIVGMVIQFVRESDLDDHGILTVQVRQAHALPGVAHLFPEAPGKTLAFFVRLSDIRTDPRPGQEIRFRARKAGHVRAFADARSLEFQ